MIVYVLYILTFDFFSGTKLCLEGVQLLFHIRFHTGSSNEDIGTWMWTVYE